MDTFNTYPAELYAVGNTATVITEGFAFRTTNDASLRQIDGEVKATKFGVHQVGPSSVRGVREQCKETDGEIFNVVEKDTFVTLYFDNSDYYVKSTITRVFTQDEYALYDRENKVVYNIEYDNINTGEYNLVGSTKSTVQKISSEEFEKTVGSRYIPLVKIEKSRR